MRDNMNQDIDRILISEEELQKRISELGAAITEDFRGRDPSSSACSRAALFLWPTCCAA